MSKRCNRLQRWFHRRWRQYDRRHLWAALEALPHETLWRRSFAWGFFTAQRGQEHWRCECAQGADQYGEPHL